MKGYKGDGRTTSDWATVMRLDAAQPTSAGSVIFGSDGFKPKPRCTKNRFRLDEPSKKL